VGKLSTVDPVAFYAHNQVSQVAAAALARILSGEAAERVVDRTLRAHRELDATQRTALVEVLFGVSLWRRRLAFQVGRADPPALIFSFLRDLYDVPADHAARLAGLSEPIAQRSEPVSFPDRHSMPDWLAETLLRELGDEADAFADAINRRGPISLRANRLMIEPPALAERLASEGVCTRPGALARTALVVESARPNIVALPSHRAGLFEVQDEGSQLLGLLVGARPFDSVLDLCAGAGGKTLLLAGELSNQGALHAFDPDREKLGRLRDRAARAGVTCLQIHFELPADLAVDCALVDAPCSELGALRRGPDLRWRIDPAGFAAFPALQLELLEIAARAARRTLLYATCTLRREENEDVALAFERAHPQWRRAGDFHRFWPHRHGSDAFFAAVYHRAS
jgi:16S rRNA (cytosine967-C5)-methyltransferase